MAYILQEGAARLSIVSGSGLGQAMRFHFGAEVGQIPIICAVVAIGVLVGNSSYEAVRFYIHESIHYANSFITLTFYVDYGVTILVEQFCWRKRCAV